MMFLVKHISATGAKTEHLICANSSSEAMDKVLHALGDALACVCLRISGMSAAQRAAWGA